MHIGNDKHLEKGTRQRNKENKYKIDDRVLLMFFWGVI